MEQLAATGHRSGSSGDGRATASLSILGSVVHARGKHPLSVALSGPLEKPPPPRLDGALGRHFFEPLGEAFRRRRSPGWSLAPASSPLNGRTRMRIQIILTVAALVLSGCNANQEVNLSSRRARPVRHVDADPRGRRWPLLSGLQSLQSHRLRTEQHWDRPLRAGGVKFS